MKFMKQTFGEFHEFPEFHKFPLKSPQMEEKFCLSDDRFELDLNYFFTFIVSRNYFNKKRNIVTDGIMILYASNLMSRLMTKPTKWHVRPAKTVNNSVHSVGS